MRMMMAMVVMVRRKMKILNVNQVLTMILMMMLQVLRNVMVGQLVMNQQSRARAMAPMLNSAAGSWNIDHFAYEYEQKCGRCVPRAILQSLRSMLAKYGHGNHFDNSCGFAVDMDSKCRAVWSQLAWLLENRHSQDVSDECLHILQSECGLGPFSAVLIARLLSVTIDPALYNFDRQDIGQYAAMGLLLLSGMSADSSRAYCTMRKGKEAARALFPQLLEV